MSSLLHGDALRCPLDAAPVPVVDGVVEDAAEIAAGNADAGRRQVAQGRAADAAALAPVGALQLEGAGAVSELDDGVGKDAVDEAEPLERDEPAGLGVPGE